MPPPCTRVLHCTAQVSGPSPLHGTIVNNVETDCSKQAFNTRVSNVDHPRVRLYYISQFFDITFLG